MKKVYKLIIAAISLFMYQTAGAQCTGVKGPNLLGAKGTFSVPFITVNSSAANCTKSGFGSFNPSGNVGNALAGCSAAPGSAIPCSDYTYTAASGGLKPEFTYSIVKTIGNNSGGNCLKGDWRGSDHTGDGGYFMAVNGAPNSTYSSIFYQIKSIPVCIGTTYEFSAWVINLLPATSGSAIAGSQPNISFKVNGTVIGNSGPIGYSNTPVWVKVGGSFVATTDMVDLQVVNATAVASGNDLGLDDISINVCGSQIQVNGPDGSTNGTASVCEGSTAAISYIVTDPTNSNSWCKIQKSVNGGSTFTDISSGSQATYTGSSFTIPYSLGIVNSSMNGYKYRMVVSTSQAGLTSADCGYFNDFTLIVTACGPLPVKLSAFSGKYSSGIAELNWQTSQELNSDYFELFRSYDADDFVSVGKIPTAGFSSTIKNYSYRDKVGNSNYAYYKLKQVDVGGKETFSPVIKLSLGTATNVQLFPNPFNSTFTITLGSSKTNSASLKVQNATGQIVFSKMVSLNKGNNSIVVNSLPASLGAGLYYITIANEEINFTGKLQKL